jgi:hypothetical protein
MSDAEFQEKLLQRAKERKEKESKLTKESTLVDTLQDATPEVAQSIISSRLSSIALDMLSEHIVKVGSEYELESKKTGRNLGKYSTKSGAIKREAQVEFFKHKNEDVTIVIPEKFAKLKALLSKKPRSSQEPDPEYAGEYKNANSVEKA